MYRLDAGFVRSLENPNGQSCQIDLPITWADFGYPLAVLPKTKVFPIEAILGFLEVTRILDKEKLEEDFNKMKELKQKTKRKIILPYSYVQLMGLKPANESQIDTIPEFLKTDVPATAAIPLDQYGLHNQKLVECSHNQQYYQDAYNF